jgi:DNA-binding NtrC family response regulator
MRQGRVLLVDDDRTLITTVRRYLELAGFEVTESHSLLDAQRAFLTVRPDVTIIDHELPDGDAIELLAALRAMDAGAAVIVLTGHASIDLAVRAMKEGAENFLTKPVELAALVEIVRRTIENRTTRRKLAAATASAPVTASDPFLGTSAAIRALRERAARVAASESTVLIVGETGSGKGILARWLHAASARADEPFVDINCAGLAHDFLETELFGHEKGAFTGAVNQKQGLLEVADRGTLFLDEIGDVDITVQPKLLKVLEEQRFRRLGDVHDRAVDIRLVAATHHDLMKLSSEGRFREDLYYRISAIPLHVPPLRERKEDIAVIAREVLLRLDRRATIGDAAMQVLQQHAWPGNIRELRNVLERGLLVSDGAAIRPEHLSFDLIARKHDVVPEQNGSMAEVEKHHIERVLREQGGVVKRAAEHLGISRSALHQKIKRYAIVFER